MLTVEHLDVFYGHFQALWDVSLRVADREIVAILGLNGSGKSTLLNSVSGLVQPRRGSVILGGQRIEGRPTYDIVRMGVGHVLERRRVFPYMTVLENLRLGSYLPEAKRRRRETLEWVYSLFPTLRARARQWAYSLSGGEQQMLAIARGLMSRPRLLLLDEPFLGLAPIVVKEIIAIMRRINDEGVTIVFNEQNVEEAMRIAHRGYFLESGRVILSGTAAETLGDERIRTVYLGF
jgi:branched-chain amino acid transport system ATP-binding protein